MRTLVYFASGCEKPEYHGLDFDRIILIDNCFKQRRRFPNNIFNNGKVTCVGMDCLESIEYLKKESVKIDCFVSLNEGLYEGGGNYPINSDFFLGYVMPLLSDNYIHIMNRNYYHNNYNVSMDLPYNKTEISETESDYISPFIFSDKSYHTGHAKVFRMIRVYNTQYFSFNPSLTVSTNHDSIWNHYDNLDLIALYITQQGQGDFFESIPKTIDLSKISMDELFAYCKLNRIDKVGFTPWGRGYYEPLINKLKYFRGEYPKEIFLFHLNKKDYKGIKQPAGNTFQ